MNAEAELTKALVANVGEIAVAAHRLHAVLKDENEVLATGDDAALLARGPSIDVRAAGVALEDGGAGARVRVRNASSGRTVDGVVDGPGVVAIGR